MLFLVDKVAHFFIFDDDGSILRETCDKKEIESHGYQKKIKKKKNI